MKKIDKDIKIQSTIDTTQTRDKIFNRLDVEREILGRKVIKRDDKLITDKWCVNYKEYHNGLSSSVEELNKMFELATVINMNDIKVNRIDVATDIDMKFNDIDKFLTFYFMIFTEGMGSTRRRWTDIDLEEIDALWFKRQYLEVQYYNKEKQSKEKGFVAKYPTRLEVRLKRTEKQDFRYHIDRVIKMYEEVPEKIAYLEKSRIELLCNKWDKFKEDNPGATLTHFVMAWEDKIYTRNILKGLYDYSGLSGSFKPWVDKYKRKYKLELFTEKEVIVLTKRIIKSLKEYKKK